MAVLYRLDAEWERLLDDSIMQALNTTSPEPYDAQLLEEHRLAEHLGREHAVRLRQARAARGVGHVAQQPAIVGQEEQARRVEIEPTDCVPPALGEARLLR